MPDLNKTPIPTDESINNKYRGSTLNIVYIIFNF